MLDGQANLAESDLVYTTTLMGGGTEDFNDKQVDHYEVVIVDIIDEQILTDLDSWRWGWGIAMWTFEAQSEKGKVEQILYCLQFANWNDPQKEMDKLHIKTHIKSPNDYNVQ